MTTHDLYVIRIGKAGVTSGVLEEIKKRIRQLHIVKVKFLPSAMKEHDKRKIAQELADATGSTVVQRVGFTVVLKK